VRLSAFDFVPFKRRRSRSRADGRAFQPHRLPYRYGFGVNPNNPVEYDLTSR
jgi:hypothetical protein